MKILSVRQPYAFGIEAMGLGLDGKPVENRPRSTTYRSTLGIQAGLLEHVKGRTDPHIQRLVMQWLDGRSLLTVGDVPWDKRGVIVALAELTDCHPDASCCRPWGESAYREAGGTLRPVVWHWVLEDVRPLAEPVPWKGALWLQDVDADTEAEIRRRAA